MYGRRILVRVATLATAVAALLAMTAGVAAADDLVIRGDYTVRYGDTLDAEVKMHGGTLTVHGKVDGNIDQYGSGSVIVGSRGYVNGNIQERDAGRVDIRGELNGNIDEAGGGPVIIGRHAYVNGNLKEKHAGNVEVRGRVNGDVDEEGRGSVFLYRSARVSGDVTEKGAGTIRRY